VADWLPSAEQIVVNGCGHAPQVERPGQINGLLQRFFARHDALETPARAQRRAA
jgi:pimeloyl-ACP methyl ester carboxylesterase